MKAVIELHTLCSVPGVRSLCLLYSHKRMILRLEDFDLILESVKGFFHYWGPHVKYLEWKTSLRAPIYPKRFKNP